MIADVFLRCPFFLPLGAFYPGHVAAPRRRQSEEQSPTPNGNSFVPPRVRLLSLSLSLHQDDAFALELTEAKAAVEAATVLRMREESEAAIGEVRDPGRIP